jgi:hypothetical protein
MHPLVPLAYTALILIQAAPTENGLEGFKQFTFGMSIKEANKLEEFDNSSDLDHGYVKYPLLKKYRAVGVDFGAALYFKDGVFSFATLDDDAPATIELCQRRFSAIRAKIVNTYGTGNGHPSVDINGSPDEQDYFETRRFDTWYPNNSNVRVSTTFNGVTCRMSIVLQGPTNQPGF